MPDVRSAATAAGRMTAAVVVLAALGTAAVLHARHPSLVGLLPSTDMRDLHVDFDTFRLSAVALVQGGDIYATPAKLTNLNPPLLTVLMAPFALLDALPAYRIFALLTLLLVVGAVLAVARELRLSRPVTALAAAAVLASSPLHGTLLLGQIYPLLLAGLVAGWVAERRGHPVLAAVLWGVTVACKPSLGPVLLLALALRRWRALRAGLLSAAAATLVGVLVAGPSSGLAWLRVAVTAGAPDVADNASLPGLAVRLGAPPVLGALLGAAVLVGTLGWLAWHRERVDPAGTAPWAVVAAGLLVAPIAWHNYVLLLVPGVLVLLAQRRYAIGAVLLALPVVPVAWNALWPENLAGDLARSLYCAVLLAHWAALLAAARRARPDAVAAGAPAEPAGAGAGPARAPNGTLGR